MEIQGRMKINITDPSFDTVLYIEVQECNYLLIRHIMTGVCLTASLHIVTCEKRTSIRAFAGVVELQGILGESGLLFASINFMDTILC